MMGAAERQRGNRAEQAVARYLRDNGFDAITSRSAQGHQAGSDIFTSLPFAFEVKDHARLDLSGWWQQATSQAGPDEIPVLWHKRRGFASPGRWWVTVDGDTFIRLLRSNDN
jgi:hypothetical protein